MLTVQVSKKIFYFQLALYCIQRTIRNFMIGKTWPWWQLWLKIKPTLRSAKFAEIKVSYTVYSKLINAMCKLKVNQTKVI